MSKRVVWDDAAARAIVQRGGGAGVRECAHLLLRESQAQVPLDTGALLRSGVVDSDGLSATVSYDTPYSRKWHEERANFQRNRKNKYLEDPCNDPALKAKMLNYIKGEIKF